MSENYSRRNHSSKEEKKSAPKVTKHVTKGFTVFQKVLTVIGTILSIIVASITIMIMIVMEATMIDKIVPITVSTFWKTVKPFVTCLVTFGADFFSSFDEWLRRE